MTSQSGDFLFITQPDTLEVLECCRTTYSPSLAAKIKGVSESITVSFGDFYNSPSFFVKEDVMLANTNILWPIEAKRKFGNQSAVGFSPLDEFCLARTIARLRNTCAYHSSEDIRGCVTCNFRRDSGLANRGSEELFIDGFTVCIIGFLRICQSWNAGISTVLQVK